MNIKDNDIYKDDRGEIQMVLPSCQIGSISRIVTEPDKFRANHYHLTDGHWIIINEGQVLIYERVRGQAVVTKTVLNKGDIHFTGPLIDHLMYMPVYTVFDCYSLKSRDSENYEKETIRLTGAEDNLRNYYYRPQRFASLYPLGLDNGVLLDYQVQISD